MTQWRKFSELFWLRPTLYRCSKKSIFIGSIPQWTSKWTSSSDSWQNPESTRLFICPNWPRIRVSSSWWKTGYVFERCEFPPHSRSQKDASPDFIFHLILNPRTESESSENFWWIRFFKRPNLTSIRVVTAVEENDVKWRRIRSRTQYQTRAIYWTPEAAAVQRHYYSSFK